MLMLDLFCGAGGCAAGYFRSGLVTEIVGIDLHPQPRYPFEFIQADALEYVAEHGHKFDIIHASPTCQAYSILRACVGDREYPELVEPTRELLQATGKPYVIENVPGAPLINPVMLCGTMFGLKVYRHRLFECNPWLMSPPHVPHNDKSPGAGKGLSPKGFISVVGHRAGTNGGDWGGMNQSDRFEYVCNKAMGIDWMNHAELSQAIPPAFTQWIGERLKEVLSVAA